MHLSLDTTRNIEKHKNTYVPKVLLLDLQEWLLFILYMLFFLLCSINKLIVGDGVRPAVLLRGSRAYTLLVMANLKKLMHSEL